MTNPKACPDCLRRAWLLGLAAPSIDKAMRYTQGVDMFALLGLDKYALAKALDELLKTVAPGVAASVIHRVEAMRDDQLEKELSTAHCWATCRHDDGYPDQLRGVSGAPWTLIGRGDPALLTDLAWKKSVSIVGARSASSYGREVARSLGRDLAAAGIAVISGLAFGIDACAHRGALETGRTVAISGCGPDVSYPSVHRSLWRRITERGLVISELPPRSQGCRWTLLARNRIVAGISGMTVVVEAAQGSGSLVTADFAADFGRGLGAVPGPVTSRNSAGVNGLLAGGARLVCEARDVLNAMSGDESSGGGSDPTA